MSLAAKQKGDSLLAPVIGTWVPCVSVGQVVSAGMPVGVIWRAGKATRVTAPDGAGAVIEYVSDAHSQVEYGQSLLRYGDDVRVESGVQHDQDTPDGALIVQAPMSGTLYHQSSPGAPVFAPPGVLIEENATLALVEVMKSLTPVRNAQRGRIARWLVENGEAVKAGDVIAWLNPEPKSS